MLYFSLPPRALSFTIVSYLPLTVRLTDEYMLEVDQDSLVRSIAPWSGRSPFPGVQWLSLRGVQRILQMQFVTPKPEGGFFRRRPKRGQLEELVRAAFRRIQSLEPAHASRVLAQLREPRRVVAARALVSLAVY